MSIFGKNKKNSDDTTDTPKTENSTLDLIKETMNEVEEERKAEKTEPTAPQPSFELKNAIAAFSGSKTQENLNAVMQCLQNPKTLVTIGAQIITSKEDEEKLKQGGQVKLDKPIQINPMLLTDNTGKTVFPVFSGNDTMPDDMKKKTQKVNLPFANCVGMLRNLKNVDTFVLDPYTANIRFTVNINEN